MATQGREKAGILADIRHNVHEFFYTREVPYGLAMVRILLPLAVMIPMLHRWPFVRELFSTDGAPAQLSIGYGFGLLFPEFSGTLIVGMYALMLLCLLTTSLGWNTRISTIIAMVLYTYFTFLDAISTITKYTVITTDAMIVLSMSHCGAVWSVDAWLKRRRESRTTAMPRTVQDLPRFPVWPRRLLQLLISCVYFGAAFTKIHTPAFFSGDQLRYWMITNVNFEHTLGEYMALYPVTLVFAAYITIIWEILFIFFAWRGWTRLFMLGLGAMFHAMTCLTLGLYIFPLVCTSIYWSFLNERDIQRISAWMRRKSRQAQSTLGAVIRSVRGWQVPALRFDRLPRVPSPVAFTVTAALLTFGAIEIEYRADHYGLRRAEGAHQLPRLDRELALSMLQSNDPIRTEDKFYSFDLGTTLVGEILANRRDQFTHGDTVIAQCSMNPPYEDMWVECNLHDADDRIIDRTGMVISREMMRANYLYQLGDALEPGDYFLVLKSGGKEVARRPFRLKGQGSAPLAN